MNVGLRLEPRLGEVPMSASTIVRYCFGNFELQPAERLLLKAGAPVAIRPRAFDVLVALVERHGHLVTTEDLLGKAWPGVIVEENAVHAQVSALRKLLGPDAIKTVLGGGYRFAMELAPAGSTAKAPRHNLVRQLTSFIGREPQIAELKALLEQTQLLTLTGAGGCGKTRLALELAIQVSDAYADGVWLVELAALADGQLVAKTVAEALGLKERMGESYTQTLLGHLSQMHLLLVLDNAEHLLADCAELARTLLQRCARLTILVTSRERLGVPGELVYRVPSLSVPDPDRHHVANTLLAYESARLFIERARLQQARFALTAQSAAAVASICSHLDGIPLAIELAAARVRALSVEEVGQRLDQRFRLLTDSSRTSTPRHRTLRALIDWSYDLLNEREKAVLCRASVFAGGFTLDAAERVLSGAGVAEAAMLDLLTSLVDKSLVAAEADCGSTRYRMLETVRQYAMERLRKDGDEAPWRARHLAWSATLAEGFSQGLKGPEVEASFARIASELDNLRAAVAWAIESDPGQGIRLAFHVRSYMNLRGHVSEGQKWLTRLLDVLPADASPLDRAHALHAVARLTSSQGDYSTAERQLQESLALYREVDDPEGAVRALGLMAALLVELGRYAEAEVLAREAFDRAQEAGDRPVINTSRGHLANALHGQGQWAAARELFKQSLEAERTLGRRENVAWFLKELGRAECDQGQHDFALEHFAESMTLSIKLGAFATIVDVLEGYASVAAATGAPIRAVRLWGAAAALRQENGTPKAIRERMIFDRQVQPVRDALTPDEFDQAWHQGRAMSLEDAVRLALADQAMRDS